MFAAPSEQGCDTACETGRDLMLSEILALADRVVVAATADKGLGDAELVRV